MTSESEIIQALTDLRKNLNHAKYLFGICGFGFEIDDAISELVSFAEFELDERGVEYE